MDISVIVCTHNPRTSYFVRVLAALRGQSLPLEQWELLIVDNASLQPLTTTTWDLSWHPRARIVREEELGIAAARMRGMREAIAELLVFVDDDNVLDPSYLAQALKIEHEWPKLGVWGGSIVPEFETDPAPDLRNFLSVLALREVKSPKWSNVASYGNTDPWGAGMCLRATVAAKYHLLFEKSKIQIRSRIGKDLSSGEDTEICYVACSMGLGTGLFPTLRLSHLIPKERVDEDYVIRIFTAIHTSLHLIEYKWHGQVPESPYSLTTALRICKQYLLERRLRRRIFMARLRASAAARRLITADEGHTPPAMMHPSGILS